MILKASDILILGMNKKVAVVWRATGHLLWEQKLPGGGNFVTVLCVGGQIYACSSGHLHCLALETGQLLWTNDLTGYGYGLTSLCIPDGGSAPDSATLAQLFANQQASNTAANTPSQ